MKTRLLGVVCALWLCSCVTQSATYAPVPLERRTECEKICTDLGMKLGAVVVIKSAAGCVCEPAGTASAPVSRAAATAAAGAAIAAEEETQQQPRR